MYFYRRQIVDESIKGRLEKAPKGTKIEVVANQHDHPQFSDLYICTFIELSGNEVYFEMPLSGEKQQIEHSKLKTDSGIQVLSDSSIYYVDVSYVWGIYD